MILLPAHWDTMCPSDVISHVTENASLSTPANPTITPQELELKDHKTEQKERKPKEGLEPLDLNDNTALETRYSGPTLSGEAASSCCSQHGRAQCEVHGSTMSEERISRADLSCKVKRAAAVIY